jgi:hypothetical protein
VFEAFAQILEDDERAVGLLRLFKKMPCLITTMLHAATSKPACFSKSNTLVEADPDDCSIRPCSRNRGRGKKDLHPTIMS